ncbi:hypothetical protein M8J75_005634 [Diaphorina citri]|nr:hypothetical protein M8J75_005634 [Diaphorina citri]KAI5748285.1 hypothetical protein M8J77_023855 [Diaphorina citri]
MSNLEQLSLSACSEDTNSISDEEKIRQLFQVCDNDGDGYIDSHDLAAVCQDLNLEYCLEDLMLELGADQSGKISYQEFLQKRLALKPEIDALRKKTADYQLTSSDMSLGAGSLGKHECWEFDSGARDLSPEPNTLQRLVEVAGGSSLATSSSGNLLQLANKLHLAALSSLRNEILDLNTRLQNVTEERDMYEKLVQKSQSTSDNPLVQQYEEQLTELHSVIAELSRKLEQQRNLVITEEDEFTDTQSMISHTVEDDGDTVNEDNDEESPTEEGERKKNVRNDLKPELTPNAGISQEPAALVQISNCSNCQQLLKENELLKNALERSHQKIQHIEQSNDEPIMKIAEKVQLKKLGSHVTGSDFLYSGVSNTQVAEHLVSNVRDQCTIQELPHADRKQMEIETEKLNAKLEHVKIQNSLLEMNANEMKTHCERLTVLLGKYESNAIALELALDLTDKMLETYKVLLHTLQDRPDDKAEMQLLLNNIDKLDKERASIGNTTVKLESYHVAISEAPKVPKSSSEARKMDLEMAVLMQELLSMREDKAELRARIYNLEHEKDVLEMKLNSLACEELTQHAGDTDDKSVENKLRERLKEMSQTLERVSRTYELRQMQSTQLTNELKMANNALMNSFEKGKKKSQSRLKRLENEIVIMSERHATQVQHLKQRIVSLEEHIARYNSKERNTS